MQQDKQKIKAQMILEVFRARPLQPGGQKRLVQFATTLQQTILRYLKSSARAPIMTIYELANLITNSCANVFDQYSVPDAFQFLDFFERSIGNIVSWFTKSSTLPR